MQRRPSLSAGRRERAASRSVHAGMHSERTSLCQCTEGRSGGPESVRVPARGAKRGVLRRCPGVTLCQGDARAVLCSLPRRSVDCVVTSPPYWGLRDYRVAGQYGTEPTVDGYIASLVSVFDEIARVLVSTGTVWLNLADTFGGSWGNYVAPGSTAATAVRRAGWRQGAHRPPQARHRAKDLVGVPWRVVLALGERGWLLRNAVVWVKPNARPESVRDRLSQRYEWVFLFARSADHWFAPLSDAGGDVWRIASPRAATKHVAAGSVELARRCIAAGARPGGVVLDPFSGSELLVSQPECWDMTSSVSTSIPTAMRSPRVDSRISATSRDEDGAMMDKQMIRPDMPLGEIAELPTVLDLMTAARALGIGRTTAYALARDGGFPCAVIRVGGAYRVPTAGLLAVLGLSGSRECRE